MSAIEVTDDDEIVRAAYWLAWRDLQNIAQTPDEKRSGPHRLHEQIRRLVENGACDPQQIAATALGLLREAEQIARSKARVTSGRDDDAASAS